MRAIVIDDEREIAEHIAYLIEKARPELLLDVYASGTKALEAIRHTYYDLIVTDIVMPVTDGFAILRYVAENSPSSEVVFLTAYRTFDFIYQANQVKRIDYLVKTEDDATILRVLMDSLRRIDVYHEERRLIAQAEAANASALDGQTDVVRQESDIIRRIKEYIDAHISDDINVNALAARFHYSVSYISRVFKYHCNNNLSAYIMQKKMNEAKRLLQTTNISIQDLSKKLGYQNSQAFARAFRRETRMSPREYRIGS